MAVRLNKVIFVNKNQNKEQHYNLERLKEAIHAVTGLSFEEYTARNRCKELVYARMLFAHYCFVVENIPILEIAGMLKRDRATLIYALNKYNDDVKYNPKFRELVNNIKKVLVEFE
jgi:chromosomal replication initiation ATPase DnaA